MKDPRLDRFLQGFGPGRTAVCRQDDTEVPMGMDFFILRACAGETIFDPSDAGFECAWLLMDGTVLFQQGDKSHTATRTSLFSQDPYCMHVPAGCPVTIRALADCELALFRVTNDRSFSPRFYDPKTMLECELRDRGRWNDTAYRVVRTIFDNRNNPDAQLVLGEVVNFGGRWSSYPPHHHPQPEIYHYRFSMPQGYGHGELGDDVLKIRQYDTLRISGGNDHSQVAAPGYEMYYIWAIRHLPGNRYTTPEFTAEHVWLKDLPFTGTQF
ncbi:MAG TPA: 5-deoxy-glucuronate isomerase [Myxococcota bacterium]|nr:5-deoxy-glucuronate isomerase [Myxococcota bacterium]HOH77931.1 5-deoxy-glucuronate isomerase [Myxococcota bacterium]